MKRKFVWLMMSCFTVAALVLSSCAAAEEEEVVVPKVEGLSHEALQKLEEEIRSIVREEVGLLGLQGIQGEKGDTGP